MVKKEKLRQQQVANGGGASSADAMYAAERNIWGAYHKNTGEKHDAKGKERLRDRAAEMRAALVTR